MNTFCIPYVNVIYASHVERLEGGVRITFSEKTLNIRHKNLIFVEEIINPSTGEVLFRVAHLRHAPDVLVKNAKKSDWLGNKVKKQNGGWIHFASNLCNVEEGNIL